MRRNYLPLAVLFPLAMSSACSKDAPADSAAPALASLRAQFGDRLQTGGVEALHTVLASLPADCPPTLIVQHINGCFARAIAESLDRVMQPRVMLLDEPTLGLAPLIIAQIFDIIRTIRDQGVTVFLVEQNANKALQVADRGYVLENGRVVLQDTGANLLVNAEVRRAYLGA